MAIRRRCRPSSVCLFGVLIMCLTLAGCCGGGSDDDAQEAQASPQDGGDDTASPSGSGGGTSPGPVDWPWPEQGDPGSGDLPSDGIGPDGQPDPTVVPAPAGWVLGGIGLGMVALLRRRLSTRRSGQEHGQHGPWCDRRPSACRSPHMGGVGVYRASVSIRPVGNARPASGGFRARDRKPLRENQLRSLAVMHTRQGRTRSARAVVGKAPRGRLGPAPGGGGFRQKKSEKSP